MNLVLSLLTGGFLKDYRTQALGIATALVGIIGALTEWSTGSGMDLATLIQAIENHIEVIGVGTGVWFSGDKLNSIAGKKTIAVPFKFPSIQR